MHIDTLAQARETQRREKVKAFSFDVFDTFLLRRCTTPAGVYERTFELAGIPASHRHLREAFIQHRQWAEARARETAQSQHGQPEVEIEGIYSLFPCHVFGLGRHEWPRLVQAEFQAEMELCLANPPVLELFRQMRAAGLRCGFVSDTYWSAERLGALLVHAAPGLQWDFLYPSCDVGRCKGAGLFSILLADLGLDGAAVAHLGDNEWADLRAARRHGMHALHLPQASASLAGIHEREGTVLELLCRHMADGRTLDHGVRTARRLIAATAPQDDPAFTYGLRILGPVFTAFHRFVAERVEKAAGNGGKVAVVFLARDAWLPWRLWDEQTDAPAHYVEINRRIALVGSALSATALCEFFRGVPKLDLKSAQGFLKLDTPTLQAYFAQAPGGVVSGKEFAADLPQVLTADEIAGLSAEVRASLLDHLSARIPDFAHCTDLVLVDLGYAGTVQRSLRVILDREGVACRLHGLYLLSEDQAFTDLAEGDSAEGLLSDAVITPHAKRALLNNIALIEQLASAPNGSIRSYTPSGEPEHEPDPRPQLQHDLAQRAQEGALYFARALAASPLSTCLDGPDRSAPWIAAILGRALMLPTDDELMLMGRLRQDVNLGSQALAALLDAPLSRSQVLAKALPAACTCHEPPMWPAAGLSAQSPLSGLHYALFATGLLPGDIAGDIPCGTAHLALAGPRGGQPVAVTTLRTGDGALRLRVPVLAKLQAAALVLPAGAIPPRGLIQGAALQQGETTAFALEDANPVLLPLAGAEANGVVFDGQTYEFGDGEGYLAIPLPALTAAVGVVTVTITSLAGSRVLALSD